MSSDSSDRDFATLLGLNMIELIPNNHDDDNYENEDADHGEL